MKEKDALPGDIIEAPNGNLFYVESKDRQWPIGNKDPARNASGNSSPGPVVTCPQLNCTLVGRVVTADTRDTRDATLRAVSAQLDVVVNSLKALEDAFDADTTFHVGDKVQKTGGDYTFEGVVIGVAKKKSGKIRYCVEDDRGIIHIFSDAVLEVSSP